MKTLIIKFGGASVATPGHFRNVAALIRARREYYSSIVVVVSAMSGTTEELRRLSQEVHPEPPLRELDMLLTAGERISIALLAMALHRIEIPAISFTGSQSGIITTGDHNSAYIVDVRPQRLIPYLKRGTLAIVAGFQGVTPDGEITSLGKGGSDTSAVALGVALDAEVVEFYKDVSGIYREDPKQNVKAELLAKLNFDAAYLLMSQGAKILHPRSVLLASKNSLPLHVLSFYEAAEVHTMEEFNDLGTWIGEKNPDIKERVSVYESSMTQ
jgi:aspartate kinase